MTSEKTIKLEEYYPPGSVALITNNGSVVRSDLLNSSFDFFYSIGDDISQSTGVSLLTSSSTSRALIFAPTGSGNYQPSTASSPVTIASGVYGFQSTTTTGIFGSITYSQRSPDFVIFRGSIVE
jgi:hypothetical protein